MAKLVINLNGMAIGEQPLNKERITIGRSPTNDIHLDDATVSGKHALFNVSGRDVFVEDLESTNGTLLNGKKVQRHLLRNGDTLKMGQHELVYVDESAPRLDATVIISAAQREALKAPQELAASLKILNGPKSGEFVELNKPYNTVGKPGVQVAVIAKRSQGFFLVPMTVGNTQGGPKLNNNAIGAGSIALKNGDVLEVAGVRLEFQQKG